MPESLTRRQLLKSLGIAGVGITLASAELLPEMAEAAADSVPPGENPHPFWWVKHVDKPTLDIDWDMVEPFNTTRTNHAQYRTQEENDALNKAAKENLLKWETNKVPGYTTKDFALRYAAGSGQPALSFMGPQKAPTPQERGVPRYEGSPEENTRILRVALRSLGASNIGVVELETNTTRKLIYSEEAGPNGTRLRNVFENIDVGYEDEEKRVIPEKARYAVVYSVQMSNEILKYSPTQLGHSTVQSGYTHIWMINEQAAEFLRVLGYNYYGPSRYNSSGLLPYPALAVLGGLGEISRLNRVITPEVGPSVRLSAFLTDLPLAPTKPIDFGVMRFCKTCKTCASNCPSHALSLADEPTWETQGPWNNPGHKTYYENSVRCRAYQTTVGTLCGSCFSVCPFAVADEASMHRIIKGIVSSTGTFNSALVSASHQAFPSHSGEPLKAPENWWQNQNMAEFGIDSRVGGRKI